jgi:GMP synthase-like glutamine amidotransferase
MSIMLLDEITEDENFGRKALYRKVRITPVIGKISKDVLDQDEPTTMERHLKLMMLGCEDNKPYGPTDHTAAMFLNLICQALEEVLAIGSDSSATINSYLVSITIYRVQQGEYPQSTEEWDWYDGVLLPGSFSSAYDPDPWIAELSRVVQTELYDRRRPTLGVCFGHQLFAHSFSTGKASKVPVGPQGGRKTLRTTEEGNSLLKHESLDLYYTHGDMVQALPSCAINLGGNDHVPIQAAAYYSSDPIEGEKKTPIAVTFQSHPEYVTAPSTLTNILEAMTSRGDLTIDERIQAEKDAEIFYSDVRRQSLDVMIASGRLLGWFPS